MRRYFFQLSIGLICAYAHGQTLAHPHLPDPPVVDYSIHATLDAESKHIVAEQTLIYTNHSPDTIPDLHFHLYLNAFKNERTTFWRESGGRLRDDDAAGDGWGYIDVTALSVGGEDRLADWTFIRPDDGNEDDETVAKVDLREPLAPGESITITFDFQAQLPKVFARTGYNNDYMLVGQWFPKIGLWETAGARNRETAGWNCHQFHATTEFYADYGRYAVTLDVPSEYVIGATGQEIAKEVSGDRTVYTFVQDDVIDFAWTASPQFIREVRPFVAAEHVSDAELQAVMDLHGITRDEASLHDVDMILLLQPHNKRMGERYFESLAYALKYFGLWYGRYPYKTITLVDPAYGADGSGGMEYPTFITGYTDLIAPGDALGYMPFVGGPEEVTVHEFGHQYWQSMVGSNEFEEPWLDEGFNSYSTGLAMDRAYKNSAMYFPILGVPLSLNWALGLGPATHADTAHAGFLLDPGGDAVVRRAWEFESIAHYFINSYPKTEASLLYLQAELGDEVMARVMRTYFQRWQFRHPTTSDFIAVAEEVSGRDLSAFFDQVVLQPNWVNYYVSDVTSDPIGGELGVFDIDGERITVDADENNAEAEEESDGPYRSRVSIARDGNMQRPVSIEVTFANGETKRETWDGVYRWVAFDYPEGPAIDRVDIDPDYTIQVETVRTDNAYVVDGEEALSLWKWPMYALLLAQHVILSLGGL